MIEYHLDQTACRPLRQGVSLQMSDFRHSKINTVLKLLNIALITLPFAFCWLYYYTGRMALVYYSKGNGLIVVVSALLYAFFCQLYEGFSAYLLRKGELVYSQSLSALMSNFLMYFICFLLTKRFPSVWPLLLAFLAQICLSVLWVYLAQLIYRVCFSPLSTALVHNGRCDVDKLRHRYLIDENFHISAVLSIDDCLQDDFKALEGIQALFVFGLYGREREQLFEYCLLHRLTVYMLPGIGDIMIKSASAAHMSHMQLLRLDGAVLSPEYLVIKRGFDVAASLLALLIFSPILLLTALAIKLYDGGPVLYKQRRLTKDGKSFSILKFRSMRVDAEKDGVARLSTGKNDARITPVGRFIRSTRIDELPQLFNILRGDMSIVGPRPERPEIAAVYEKNLPEFSLRLLVKAGLTGYAQVYGQYNSSPYEKLQMDLMYIANAGLVEDLRIVMATIKILFMSESTEGVQAGQETAEDELGLFFSGPHGEEPQDHTGESADR